MLDFGFYNMDCMEGMKQFPDKYFDLAVVDPPYGINIGQSSMGAGGGVAPHRNRATANLRSRRREQDTYPIRREEKSEMGGGTAKSAERNPSGKSQVRVGGGSRCLAQNLQGVRRQPHPERRIFQRIRTRGKASDYFRWQLFSRTSGCDKLHDRLGQGPTRYELCGLRDRMDRLQAARSDI